MELLEKRSSLKNHPKRTSLFDFEKKDIKKNESESKSNIESFDLPEKSNES